MNAEQRLLELGCTIDGCTVRDANGMIVCDLQPREKAIEMAESLLRDKHSMKIIISGGDERTTTYQLWRNGELLAEIVHQDGKGEAMMLIELAMKWVENDNAEGKEVC